MKKPEQECLICKGRGYLDIRSGDPLGKTETKECPICIAKREEYFKHIRKMSIIWKNAWNTCLISDYMTNPHTEEEKIFLDKHPFFKVMRHSLFRVAVLETAKLVKPYKMYHNSSTECSNGNCPNKSKGKNKSDKFTIEKLFNNSEVKSKKCINLQIQLWDEYKLKHHHTITGVIELRDKLYAHSDDFEIKDPGFTYEDLKGFLSDIRKLISNLNQKLTFSNLIINTNLNMNLEQRLLQWDDFLLLIEKRKEKRKNI